MLSPRSAPVVRATLPVVGAAIEQITDLFYRRLFEECPELLRDLFNRGNQANGSQQQALAGSIAAFAGMLLERPDDRPDQLLLRIAHKHASLGIAPDQYRLVHRHLFAAIAEVLGEDTVTPEVAAAWDEVYWLMANALIAVEARLYREAGATGTDTWRRMVIVERRTETPDTVSLTLRPADGRPLTAFRPGQYLSVRAPLPDGARQIRQYSLSGAPGRPQWRITVKRVAADGTPDGEVSHWLHAHARPGVVLTVSAPFGDLVLPPGDEPLLLASAGIGCTPMLSMLDHLARTEPSRRVTVVHADRTPATHAHREELHALVARLPRATLRLWYEDPGDVEPEALPGRVDVSALDLPDGVTAYLCGPLPFLRAVRDDLLHRGVPARSIHYEVFGPDLWLGQK
ncbi:globin domain-containing protein [Streptomyces sp. NPDC127068]|uniref:globin domain-containing protein n=1 Tax=Streptomyces sp. NPDC127068 TaxID=3347127 RepID=UPI003647FB06